MKNYISKLREKIGKDKFIHPAARIIVENNKEEVLFIERADNGMLGIPAGGLEENETIEKCIIREVREETGLEVLEVTVIGISSNPGLETVEYSNGDKIQYFVVEFYTNKWTGKLKVNDIAEIKKAVFKNKSYLNKLPKNEQSILDSLDYFHKNNRISLK